MNRLPTLTLACLLLAGGHALAQNKSADRSTRQPAPAPAAAATATTDGEVRKIDKAAGKITLKHGAIKNLDMPPMTMVFQVRNPALLDKVKAGDKVRFTADQIEGVLTLLSIEKAK